MIGKRSIAFTLERENKYKHNKNMNMNNRSKVEEEGEQIVYWSWERRYLMHLITYFHFASPPR
jgi:hypothetical protein